LEVDRDAFGGLSSGDRLMVDGAFFARSAVLEPTHLDRLPGFGRRPLLPARRAFHRSCEAIAAGRPELRPAAPIPAAWRDFFSKASRAPPSDESEARLFFMRWFQAFRVRSEEGGFFTGYYEPDVPGRLCRSPGFTEPLRARPPDLITFRPGDLPLGPGFEAGRLAPDGTLAPFPTRKQIENDEAKSGEPLLWVRDAAEAFAVHVQGSARVRLADGAISRLTYAGRNGRPYASIGKRLAAEGHISRSDMSPDRVYDWVRAHGLGRGERGREMLQTNESYIFFERNAELTDRDGPIGAAGIPLGALASMAVDRTVWPYGLPYWVGGGWSDPDGAPFAAMLIGQDTGAAIVGAARGDIFFGSGDAAGRAAGEIRHRGEMFVLAPNLAASTS
jgi:membrane-bound lytic murein transglycosylase A